MNVHFPACMTLHSEHHVNEILVLLYDVFEPLYVTSMELTHHNVQCELIELTI